MRDVNGEPVPRFLVMGQAIGIHIDDRFIEKGVVQITKMKPIARCGYQDYTVLNEVFALKRPDGDPMATVSLEPGGQFELSGAPLETLHEVGAETQLHLDQVRAIMRIRHGLTLDQPDDFDVITQDAALQVWDQVSQATFLALLVISSIALMVGGIGVMAIMSISVTERTREIGVRKALGARRSEILFQFLTEAAFLTSLGGVLGIALGSGIGWLVHLVTGFPISLPWWSFAIGLGFSASVGIFFGMWPAVKASRLDPIDALRYE